jgi:hypothetical protein
MDVAHPFEAEARLNNIKDSVHLSKKTQYFAIEMINC